CASGSCAASLMGGPYRSPAHQLHSRAGWPLTRSRLVVDLDFAQPMGVDVVDEATDDVAVQHERRAAHAQDRLTYVRIEVRERLDREGRRNPGGLLQLGAKSVVGERLHA